MSRLRWSLPLVAILCLPGVTACGGGSSGDNSALPTFKPDIGQWRTPLDSYVVDPAKEQFARDLVYGQCLRKAGYVPPKPMSEGSFIPPTFNKNLRSLFDVSIAKKYGYHRGRPPGDVTHEAPAHSAEEREARANCASKTSAALKVSDSETSLVYSYKSAAYQTALKTSAFVAAAQQWHQCMLPLGLPDLPAQFEDGVMPTDSQRERFGMRRSDAVDEPVKSVMPTTVAEIREATFDARCREKSGLTRTLYNAEVKEQKTFLKKERERFGKAYRSSQASESTLDQLIDRYAK